MCIYINTYVYTYTHTYTHTLTLFHMISRSRWLEFFLQICATFEKGEEFF